MNHIGRGDYTVKSSSIESCITPKQILQLQSQKVSLHVVEYRVLDEPEVRLVKSCNCSILKNTQKDTFCCTSSL